MDRWSEYQRRWDEEWERANTCMFGCNCREQLNCPFLHSSEERQLFKDEDAVWFLRAGRGFGACCARDRPRRFVAERISEGSGYESSGASAEGDISDSALAGDGCSGKDDGWRTQDSGGSASTSSAGDHWSGDDGCSDGTRFAPLWVEDERHEEKIVRGVGLLGGEADFRFDGGKTRRERATKEEAAAAALSSGARRGSMWARGEGERSDSRGERQSEGRLG